MVYTNLNALINRIYPGIGNPRTQDNQYFLDHIILYPGMLTWSCKDLEFTQGGCLGRT